MQIQAINYNQPQKPTNFKSAIPVVYWEKIGSKYELVNDINKVMRMQDILVRRANGTGGKSKEAIRERWKVMQLLYNKDRDYRLAFDRNIIPGNQIIEFANGVKKFITLKFADGKERPITLKLGNSVVSSFYPKKEYTGWIYGKFNPLAVLMTGPDYEAMKYMGRGIGLETKRGSSKEIIQEAKSMYADKGNYLSSMPIGDELHVIMEESKGGYKLNALDMRPSTGPESPYAKMGYYK